MKIESAEKSKNQIVGRSRVERDHVTMKSYICYQDKAKNKINN